MAITADIASTYTCPKCGNSGANAFVFQNRVTIKQPHPDTKPEILDVFGSVSVYACADCGYIVKTA